MVTGLADESGSLTRSSIRSSSGVIGFSSVSHMGYVIIGITAFNIISLNAAVFMMFAHGIMAALFFTMVGTIYHKAGTRMIGDFSGLAHHMPRLAVGFMISGLACLGLPGLINFIGEFMTFIGVYQTYHVVGVLTAMGIIFASIYNIRAVGNILFGPRIRLSVTHSTPPSLVG